VSNQQKRKKDRRGQRIGLLTITKRACVEKYGLSMWHCRCDCGGRSVVAAQNLNAGLRKLKARPHALFSCGDPEHRCGHASTNYIHGGRRYKRREYNSWTGLRQRCNNPKCGVYEDYGGRGITVCARWMEKGTGFVNFLADMGPCPEGMSIDRENVMGNYEPGNCRWADRTMQSNNRRCMYTPEQLEEFQREADERAAPPDVF
jgi:hypothetical protein